MFNRNNRGNWLQLGVLCLMTGVLAPAHALTATPETQSPNLNVMPAPPAAPPSQLVRELLEEDAHRALAEERRKRLGAPAVGFGQAAGPAVTASVAKPPASPATSTPAPPPPPPAPQPHLKAIVGVDGHLSAIVSLAGKDSLYASGQEMPVAGQGAGLRLVRIESPCVRFIDKNNQAISMCLREAKQ